LKKIEGDKLVRFIHTSDWQIGMKGSGLGEAATIVRNIRFESIHNVLKTSRDHNVDFVLLCGDIFEHNMVSQEDVKKVISILNEYSDISIYLLTGNHDVLGPDCVYNREIFQRVKNLTIFRTNDPIEVQGAVLHPSPIFSKFSKQDPTETIPNVKDSDHIHIAVAHGSLLGKFAVSNWEDIDLPINPSCVDSTGIDYLALGHWHGCRIFDDCNGVARIAYSGTHEQTNYNEVNAGQCLLVEIQEKGKTPKLESIRTGHLTWLSTEFEMKDSSSIKELENYFDSIKEMDMVKLVLYGELPLECKEELDNLIEYQSTMHENLRINLESLDYTLPPQLEMEFGFSDPILNQTQEQLTILFTSETDPRNKKVLIEAISNLQKFAKEGEE